MTNITIAAGSFPHYEGPAEVEIWIVANKPYVTPDGKPVSASQVSEVSWMVRAAATVDAQNKILQVPQVIVDATEDALDNPDATLSAFVVTQLGRPVSALSVFRNFKVAATPVSTNWAQIAAHNAGVSPNAPSQPAAPVATDIDPGQIDVLITAAQGAGSYALQRSTNGGAFTEIASGLSAGIYHDTSVAVLTSYAYKAVASNIFGDSPVSDPSNTVTSPQLAAPSVPTQNNPTVSGSDVHITTMATPRVAQYEIWRGSTSGGETLLATVNVATGEALDYHDTTVSTDTTYYYKIKAKNAGGTSSFSGEQPIYVPVQAIDPATVSGRILDLDGDSNGADASPVAAWADASPSANNATQGTVSKQPIVVANAVNGHKSVKLDGSDDVLNLGAAITAARTIYIVPKHATGNQDSAPVLGHASTFDFAGGMRNLLLDPTNVSASIKNGHAFVNGFEDPLGAVNLEKPVAFRVLSFVTTGNVSFGNISNDRNVGGRFWNGEYARILAFNTAHSDATRKGIELFLKTRYGATATKVLRRQFIAVGDSQTANLGYQARVVNCLAGNCASASPITDGPWSSITHAFTSYTLADMATYDSAVAGDFNANRIKQVLVLWGGTNDMYFGATGAAAYSRLLDRINAYKAAGHTQFVVLTCLPRSNSGTPAGYETERQDFNTRMRNGAPTQGWTVADIAANATIGDAGDEMNTTYYSDLVHLTNAGHDVIAPIIQAAINSLP